MKMHDKDEESIIPEEIQGSWERKMKWGMWGVWVWGVWEWEKRESVKRDRREWVRNRDGSFL